MPRFLGMPGLQAMSRASAAPGVLALPVSIDSCVLRSS